MSIASVSAANALRERMFSNLLRTEVASLVPVTILGRQEPERRIGSAKRRKALRRRFRARASAARRLGKSTRRRKLYQVISACKSIEATAAASKGGSRRLIAAV
jgi:hypothetical protein